MSNDLLFVVAGILSFLKRLRQPVCLQKNHDMAQLVLAGAFGVRVAAFRQRLLLEPGHEVQQILLGHVFDAGFLAVGDEGIDCAPIGAEGLGVCVTGFRVGEILFGGILERRAVGDRNGLDILIARLINELAAHSLGVERIGSRIDPSVLVPDAVGALLVPLLCIADKDYMRLDLVIAKLGGAVVTPFAADFDVLVELLELGPLIFLAFA